MTESPGAAPPPARALAARWRALRRRLPQVRLLWIILAALGGYGVYFLGTGLGLEPLLVLPVLAVVVDLVFARVRFASLRFPDAALATGLFLALLFPPVVPILAAAGATILAVALRHVLRSKGRPWFNPAATGVVIGALLFGIAPAWWGSINELLVIALGALLIAYEYRAWRLPVLFLGAYAALSVLQRVAVAATMGGGLAANVLILSAVDPAVIFFGLFMVAEPRTAPSEPRLQPVFAIVVAVGAALLPLVFPTLAVLLALLIGNLFTVAVRLRPAPAAQEAPTGARKRAAARAANRAARAVAERWGVGRRIGAGLVVLLLVGVLAVAAAPPAGSAPPIIGSGTPATSSGATTAASQCQTDNSSIPAATLSALHKALGPSVILSYDARTGMVVFFDPVNQVTVTETDLYEDFGFAEFNSDDYATAGCVLP